MFFASFNNVPSWLVLLTLSEPAKSTRFNFETKQVFDSIYLAIFGIKKKFGLIINSVIIMNNFNK